MVPKLSVIIPVYKVEAYLARCVESVLRQDYTDLEVILVDDGSPDGCPRICDEFARRDPRVRVIHKPNGGLSSARNAGIGIAQGEYLAFLDSDDQWLSGALSPLMAYLADTDATVLLCASKELLKDGNLYERPNVAVSTKPYDSFPVSRFYARLIANGCLCEQAGTKILKRAFVEQNQLLFKVGILCEDSEWMFRVLRSADTVDVTTNALQIYTVGREGSISNTASTRCLKDMLSIVELSLRYYDEYPNAPLKQFELAHCAYLWSICMGLYAKISHADRSELKLRLKAIGKQLDLTAHPKSEKVRRIYRTLGFYATTRTLGLYLSIRRNLLNRKLKKSC